MERRWFGCPVVIALFGAACQVSSLENPAAKLDGAPDSGTNTHATAGAHSPSAPLGAGMPVVPIRRLDGGAHSSSTSSDLMSGSSGMEAPDASVALPATAAQPSQPIDADGGERAQSTSPTTPAVSPIHRYDFAGTGTTVFDRIGSAHGQLRGGATLANGSATLDGSDDFVELPGGLVSPLQDVSVLVWVSWTGGACWERVFDTGLIERDTTQAQGERVSSSLFVTARMCPNDAPAVGFIDGAQQQRVQASVHAPEGSTLQLGFVFDSTARELRLVVNGAIVVRQDTHLQLGVVRDATTWLGRSLFPVDAWFKGRFDEVRIYDRALDAEALAHSFAAGPDAL